MDQVTSLETQNTLSDNKPSRREIQREEKKKRAVEKAIRKRKTREKAERKLAVKKERVKLNKQENSKRKLVKKIQKREENGIATTSQSSNKPAKKVFVKDSFGIPKNSREHELTRAKNQK
jgi:hypothetical protein